MLILKTISLGEQESYKNKDILRADDDVVANPKKYFDEVYEIDLSTLEPHLVGPHTPDLARPISAIAKEAKEQGWLFHPHRRWLLG